MRVVLYNGEKTVAAAAAAAVAAVVVVVVVVVLVVSSSSLGVAMGAAEKCPEEPENALRNAGTLRL